MITDLARRATVTELVNAFQRAEAQVRSSFAALVQAQRDVNLAFGFSDCRQINVSASDHWGSRFDDPDAAVARMARDAWKAIVDRLELRRAMSIKRWEDLDRQLRDWYEDVVEQMRFALARKIRRVASRRERVNRESPRPGSQAHVEA